MWMDIALIVFSAVAFSHYGLAGAIKGILRLDIPIIGCPKCLSFWCTLVYSIFFSHAVILSVAVSFLAAVSALWIDLLLGATDVLYGRIYEALYGDSAEGDTAASDTGNESKNAT